MKTKKPLDNIIIFISPTCVHCHNLIKSLPLDVFEKMKIVNSTKVSKRVQEKIPHVPYIVDKNGKSLKVKGKVTYEKLMKFSNSFGENIQKYKKIPTPRPHDSIRMKRPFGPLDNKSLKNNLGDLLKWVKIKKFLNVESLEDLQVLKKVKHCYVLVKGNLEKIFMR